PTCSTRRNVGSHDRLAHHHGDGRCGAGFDLRQRMACGERQVTRHEHNISEPDPPVNVETWNARRSKLAAPLLDSLHCRILSAYPNRPVSLPGEPAADSERQDA